MSSFSPKIEIINHFDILINRVDIDIEECLEKYNNDQVLGELKIFETKNRNIKFGLNFSITFYDTNQSYRENNSQNVDFWSKSTKVADYLQLFLYGGIIREANKIKNQEKTEESEIIAEEKTKIVDYLQQIRMRTIKELRKAQEDALEYYKSNSSRFEFTNQQTDINEMRSQLFSEKFYFQVFHSQSKPESWIFNLYTFATDFYLSPSDIDLLEKMINDLENVKHPSKPFAHDKKLILDEKMILIGLCQKHFLENLKSQKFPNHVIHVSKEEVFKIKEITCFYNLRGINLTSSSIGLCKLQKLFLTGVSQLEEIKIEDLSSLVELSIKFDSVERISIRNLFALRDLNINGDGFKQMSSEKQAELFRSLQYVDTISLNEKYSNLRLSKPNELSLSGTLSYFDLFNNLSNQLTKITINFFNLDGENINKLFDSQLKFPHLSTLIIISSRVKKLEKKLFDGFPMLKELELFNNKTTLMINHDAFSGLKQLKCLRISGNSIELVDRRHFSELIELECLSLSANRLESIEENMFSNLVNLRTLDLTCNGLKKLSAQSFTGLRKLKRLLLSYNDMTNFDIRILDNLDEIEEINLIGNSMFNKEEILNRFKDSRITFKF